MVRLYNILQSPNSAIPFVALSVLGFLSPFVNSWGAFPPSDFIFAIVNFGITILLQLGLIHIINKLFIRQDQLKKVTGLILLLLNLFFYSHVLTPDSAITLFGVAVTFSVVFLLSTFLKNGTKLLVYFVIAHLMIWTYDFYGKYIVQNEIQSSTLHENLKAYGFNTAKRSVYIIGIDSMVSKQALKLIFNQDQSVAYNWLEKNGFDLYDKQSPGDQTLTTFGAMMLQSSAAHPRTVRKLFNGQESNKLYEQLSALKFKRQFFYKDDYFGTDAGKIENFIPKKQSLNFCYYADDRWGFYFCRAYKYLIKDDNSNMSAGIEYLTNFYISNVKIEKNQKWFSIHHIWFPGHTVGKYDGKNPQEREAFIKYYISSQNGLMELFANLSSYILEKDENAVIVFFGDHGAYLLKGIPIGGRLSQNKNVTAEDIELDARGVLIAVYPQNFCKEPLEKMQQTELFFKNIAECASQ